MVGNKWQISDELWEKMAPLIPKHRTQRPLGCRENIQLDESLPSCPDSLGEKGRKLRGNAASCLCHHCLE